MDNFVYLARATLRPGASLRLPGSKSISNRTLLLAALSQGDTTLHGLLDSDDTRRMLEALSLLGVRTEAVSGSLKVYGAQGRFTRKANLFLGNAGTAFRPLTAVLAMLGGDYELSGVARMHERPIGDLVDALRQAGAQIDYLGAEGYPPLRIHPLRPVDETRVRVKGNVSSQFLTALLMALPLTGRAWDIEVIGELISKPYIDITLKLLEQFGVRVAHEAYQLFRLPESQNYRASADYYVEGDASSASYFFAAGFLSAAPVRVHGINERSIQGDVAFAHELAKLGALLDYGPDYIELTRPAHTPIAAFDIDANAIPDAAMTLAIVALAANGASRIRNIASWRVKETDRLSAMSAELRKLGAAIEEGEDYLVITPPVALTANAHIDTYDDHRMAMCFSLVSLLNTDVYINDPGCVAKTFPTYFEEFKRLTDAA